MSYIGKIAVDRSIDNPVVSKRVKVGKKIIIVDFSGPIENIPLFEKVYTFAVFCFEEEERKAFKVLNETESGSGTLLWVDYKETEGVYILTTENFENLADKNTSLENFFHGVAEVEITDSLESLEKKYSPANKHKMYIGIGVVLFVILVGVITTILNVTKTEAKRPSNVDAAVTKKTLSSIEVFQLKQQLSIELINKIHSEANALMDDELLNTKAAIRSIMFSYDLPGDDVSIKGSVGYEYKFPVRGSVLTSGSAYTKTVSFVIKNDNEPNSNIQYPLSEECVKDSLGILSSELIKVTERTNNVIKINYKEMRPDVFIGTFKNILNKCPILIENVVVLDNGMFEVSAAIYDKDVL